MTHGVVIGPLDLPRRGTVGSKKKCVSPAAVAAIRSGRVCLIMSSSGKRWLVPGMEENRHGEANCGRR